MTSVVLIHVGDFRETYFREAEAEYKKRLQKYCTYRTVCISEERVPDENNQTHIKRALEKEAEKIRAAYLRGREDASRRLEELRAREGEKCRENCRLCRVVSLSGGAFLVILLV